MENIVKKGPLHSQVRGILQSKQWQSRFYVLYGATTTNQARLDFYDSEAAYIKDASKRKTIYLEEIQEVIVSPDPVKGRDFVFDLVLDRGRKKCIATDSRDDLQDWVNVINEVRGGQHRVSIRRSQLSSEAEDTIFDDNLVYEAAGSDIFEVEVALTEAAKRCAVPTLCFLSIGSKCIEILSKPERKSLFVWPFKSIRRYGRNKNSFSFEAGRNCATGEGLFSFQTAIGEMIFESVQQRTRTLREKCNSAKGVSHSEDDAPELPDRNYNKENYMNLAMLSHLRGSQDSLDGSQNSLTSDGPPSSHRLTPPPALPKPPPTDNIYCDAVEVREEMRATAGDGNIYSDAQAVDPNKDFDAVDGDVPTPPSTSTTGYEEPNIYAMPMKVKKGLIPIPPVNTNTRETPEPEYAVYDVTKSGRFDEEEVPKVGRITTLLEQLRQNKLTDGADDATYDAVHRGSANPHKEPENLYRNVGGKAAQPQYTAENLYDDIDSVK